MQAAAVISYSFRILNFLSQIKCPGACEALGMRKLTLERSGGGWRRSRIAHLETTVSVEGTSWNFPPRQSDPKGPKFLPTGLGQRNFRLQRFGKEQREKDLNFSESWDVGVVSLCLNVSASTKYMLDYFSLLNFYFLRDAMSDV